MYCRHIFHYNFRVKSLIYVFPKTVINIVTLISPTLISLSYEMFVLIIPQFNSLLYLKAQLMLL